MVMMPFRVRQNDTFGLGAGTGAGESNFSPDPFSAMAGVNGTAIAAGPGWGMCGVGVRRDGVRRGASAGGSSKSTLYPCCLQ